MKNYNKIRAFVFFLTLLIISFNSNAQNTNPAVPRSYFYTEINPAHSRGYTTWEDQNAASYKVDIVEFVTVK